MVIGAFTDALTKALGTVLAAIEPSRTRAGRALQGPFSGLRTRPRRKRYRSAE
jgi:hypothetical protein